MNGSTNIQISAFATFASVTLLWLAGFFFPDLMATAPEMLGELFTGALIVAAGIIFKPDAGIKVIPGTGANSPAIVGLIALLLSISMLSGCVTQRPKVDSVADAIVVTSADIESIAQTVKNLCRNTVPDGPCAPGAVISTRTKDRFKDRLQDAQDTVVASNRLLAAGKSVEAGDRLSRAEAVIMAIQAELERRQ